MRQGDDYVTIRAHIFTLYGAEYPTSLSSLSSLSYRLRGKRGVLGPVDNGFIPSLALYYRLSFMIVDCFLFTNASLTKMGAGIHMADSRFLHRYANGKHDSNTSLQNSSNGMESESENKTCRLSPTPKDPDSCHQLLPKSFSVSALVAPLLRDFIIYSASRIGAIPVVSVSIYCGLSWVVSGDGLGCGVSLWPWVWSWFSGSWGVGGGCSIVNCMWHESGSSLVTGFGVQSPSSICLTSGSSVGSLVEAI